ncbi:MAG: hypothetical protein AAGA81_19675 [Acidobacteriota bacterium]
MQARTRTSTPPATQPLEGAYDIVTLGEGWGIFSLAFFGLSLATRPLLSLLPWEYRGWDMIPPLAVTLVPVLAACGLACALLGRRTKGSPSRLGLMLNSVVLVLSGLLVAVIAVWRLSLR